MFEITILLLVIRNISGIIVSTLKIDLLVFTRVDAKKKKISMHIKYDSVI